jgi:hypothetical protein
VWKLPRLGLRPEGHPLPRVPRADHGALRGVRRVGHTVSRTWRQHNNAYGRPKVAHATEAAAQIHAGELAALTSVPVDWYVCEHCGLWHVGTLWRELRRPTRQQFDELGDRAAWNLYHENQGALWRRQMAIAGRVIAALSRRAEAAA